MEQGSDAIEGDTQNQYNRHLDIGKASFLVDY